jgi:isoleucyl-tRNA synthetase
MFKLREIEENILKFWKDSRIYEKAVAKGKDKPWFNFIDGPPYPTGSIHIGTAWNKVMKDTILRFKRMRGFQVNDQPGYDMHGLPVEVKVEKEMGIKDKKEIENTIGVGKFIEACKKFSSKNMNIMSKQFARLGVWMDWKNPYVTTTDSYISSVWWALKQAHLKNRLYKGLKSITVCPRCSTALAKHELEYKNVKEDSVYLKFPVKGQPNTFLLVWTTTPWTFPGNVAIMAHPDFDYVKIKVNGENWILAKGLCNALMGVWGKKYEILEEFKGSKLEGMKYEHPLLDEVPKQKEFAKENPKAHTVVMSEEHVHLEAGTGFVHCAPGHGPEDFAVGKKEGLPLFSPVNNYGKFTKDAGKYAGMRVKKEDVKIVDDLKKKGLLLNQVEVEHEYPHCWRCKSAVIFLSVEQWFLRVEELKEKMLKANAETYWVPERAGSADFKAWLSGLIDWCISRQRYWGIPVPVWVCDKCGEMEVIGSKEELEKHGEVKELHKPWVDEITWECKCGGILKRDPDIVDVWLDSAAASWAPFGTNPHELQKRGRWPCDWIIEGKDQIRGWFYSQMGLSMVSTELPPYKAVYMHGHIQDEQGRKMSKSLGNYILPEEVISKYGSEALRWHLIMGCSPGDDLSYGWGHAELALKNLNVLYNVFKFAQRDWGLSGFKPKEFNPTRIEDKWILSRLNTITNEVTENLEKYTLPFIPRILEEFFLNDLSRWYVKLIRERTWVSSEDADKETALQVLYVVLERLTKLIAPVAPLLADYLYQENLKKFVGEESIHLLDWPESGPVNENLEGEMKMAQYVVEAALSARQEADVKLRHPLDEVVVIAKKGEECLLECDLELQDLISKMVNVKKIRFVDKFEGGDNYAEGKSLGTRVWLNTKQSEETKQEAAVRDLMRKVQVARKEKKLKVSDKIKLYVDGDDQALAAVRKFEKDLMRKTGANVVEFGKGDKPVKTVLGELKFGFEKV